MHPRLVLDSALWAGLLHHAMHLARQSAAETAARVHSR